MLDRQKFELLKPKQISDIEKEDFKIVYPRLQKALPNFPICVLEQWTYRHFDQFIYDYWWLKFDKFIFSKESWSINKIYNDIDSKIVDNLIYWGDDLYINKSKLRRETLLGKYYLANKTWPKPIIVFDNRKLEIRSNSRKHYYLLEGHMRLAYMWGQIRNNVEDIPMFHEVWLVTK